MLLYLFIPDVSPPHPPSAYCLLSSAVGSTSIQPTVSLSDCLLTHSTHPQLTTTNQKSLLHTICIEYEIGESVSWSSPRPRPATPRRSSSLSAYPPHHPITLMTTCFTASAVTAAEWGGYSPSLPNHRSITTTFDRFEFPF